MIVAIEGMDGVGKTTVAKSIQKDLGFTYVKDPLKELFEIEDEHLLRISEKVFTSASDQLIAWYLGLGDIYALEKYKDKNVVMDRHILLNYFWNGNEYTEEIFKSQVEIFGKPDLTILLEASSETRMKRIRDRNINDPDLNKPTMKEYGYDKLISFLDKYNYNYKVINTDNLNIEEVITKAKQIINDYIKY